MSGSHHYLLLVRLVQWCIIVQQIAGMDFTVLSSISTYIPYIQIPNDATNLERTHLNLTVLNDDSFQNYPTIMKLQLTNNGIVTVEPHAFRGLDNLVTLSLAENEITSVPDLRDVRKTLLTLHLEGNNISDGTSLLGQLDNLQLLFLMNNRLTQMPNLSNLTNITVVNIDRNGLTEFYPNVTLYGTISLKKLILGENNISTIGPFPPLPLLSEIYLYQNKIQELSNGTFDLVKKSLQILDLSYNNIKYITFLTHGDFPVLMHLNLENNDISDICPLPLLPTLRTLKLKKNKIKHISCFISDIAPQLQILGMCCNDMQQMPNIDGLGPTLTYLGISRNAISQFNISVFDDLVRLKTMWLSHNVVGTGILVLPHMPSVMYVHLNDMGIHNFTLLTEMPALKLLQLKDNTISVITRKLIQSAPNLELLDLDNNKIAVLSNLHNVLSNNPKLVINIANNPIHCDKSLCWAKYSYTGLNLDKVTCKSPASLRDQYVLAISDEILQCQGW